jgi:cell division protein FtsQ
MAVSPPSDRRLRRAGPRPPARAPWRLDWRIAAAAGTALVVLALAGGWALHVLRTSPALMVRHVVVEGNRWIARGEVLTLIGGLEGEHVITADLERRREALRASPWVAGATLRRTLPDTITVTIDERVPVALARIAGTLYVIDREALVIDRFGPAHAALDLPIVDGLAAAPGAAGTAIDPERAAVALAMLDELGRRPDLLGQISQIDVTRPDDTVLFMRGRAARVRVGRERVAERLQTYLEIADVLHAQVPEIEYVDLRFGERVFLQPQPPPGTPDVPARTPATRGGRG